MRGECNFYEGWTCLHYLNPDVPLEACTLCKQIRQMAPQWDHQELSRRAERMSGVWDLQFERQKAELERQIGKLKEKDRPETAR